MSIPMLVGLSNVEVPVTDLQIALDWYGRVFGFRPTIEFSDAEGVVRGVHGELPGIGDALALREDPDARGLGVFAIANFAVADRLALEAWVTHLDELGVAQRQVRSARPGLWRRLWLRPATWPRCRPFGWTRS